MSSEIQPPQTVLPLALTAFEQLMLADDRRAYPMTFFIQISVTGDLQRAEFESASVAAIRRHPLLCAIVRWRFLKPQWVAASAPIVVEWCKDTLPTPLLEERYLDLRTQPGLRISVSHTRDGSKILFMFHHAATDGIGAIQFIGDVLAEYGIATATTDDERPHLSPVDPKCLLRRGEPWESGKQPPRLLRTWFSRAVEILGVHPSGMLKRSHVPDSQRQGRPLFLTRFLERSDLKAVNKEATRRGVTSNELLAMAMYESLYQWNQHDGRDASKDVFRIGMPASVRTPIHDNCPAANIVSYILLTRRGHEIEDPKSMLNYIASESRQVLNGRETGIILLSIKLACWFPGLLRILTRLPVRLVTTVLANVGEVKRQLRNRFPLRRGKCVAGNVELDCLQGAAPVRPGTHVATSVGKYAGRLIINPNCDPQFFTAEEAEIFTDRFMQNVRQLSCSAKNPAKKLTDSEPTFAVTESESI
jgi:NRPS condensation-like uncharacterized protein